MLRISHPVLAADAGGTANPSDGPAGLAPDDLPIVPVRGFVLFPGVVMPLVINRPGSVAAAQEAIRQGRPIGILAQRDPEAAEATPSGLHRMGVVANILRYVTAPDGSHNLICQGEQRFYVDSFVREQPYLVAKVRRLEEPDLQSPEIQARFVHLKGQAVEALQLLPQSPPELLAAVNNAPTAGALTDMVAAYMDASPDEKQDFLETLDLSARMDKVSRVLAQRIEVLRLSQEISKQTRASLDERQREVLLREQMAAIQRQLGEGDAGKAQEMAELGEAIGNAQMPAEVEQAARKELRRLERMSDASAEYGMVRTYLDWLIELPWALTISGWTRSSSGSSSTWRCASWRRKARRRSCALPDRPVWARPRSASRSPRRWGASSCACRWAASMTRRRSAGTGGPMWARCRATSSRASARRGPATA
jgi:ATP-dependent Lon protease